MSDVTRNLSHVNRDNLLYESKTCKNKDLHDFMLPLIKYFYEKEADQLRKIMKSNMEKPLVFILDDQAEWFEVLKEQLNELNCTFLTFTKLTHVFAAYYVLEPDCVIVGTKHHIHVGALKCIDEYKKCYTPIIVIGRSNSKQMQRSSYSLGADDYMLEQHTVIELPNRLRFQLERKKKLDEIIFKDELTNVFNRKYFTKIYERLMLRVVHHRIALSIALLDLDNYKNVNDSYGHLVGDEVLVVLAQELEKGVGKKNIVIRLAGDEFLVVFPEHTHEQAEIKMLKILKQFSIITFLHQNKPFTCTFSCGIYELQADDTDLKSNLAKVDRVLYEAKRKKNQVLSLQNITRTNARYENV